MIGARGNRRRKSILVPSWSQHRQAGKDDKEAGPGSRELPAGRCIPRVSLLEAGFSCGGMYRRV